MEVKTTTKKTERIKNFVRNNSDTIVLGLSLVAGGLLGYKIGFSKGSRNGMNKTLDEIVDRSCSKGLIMTNQDLERYIFTAKKFED